MQVSRRLEEIAHKIGSRRIKNKLRAGDLQDWTDLKPEDILTFLHEGKLKQEDAMFWLGVLAVSAEEKARKHQAQAVTDELTRVYNRRAFLETLSRELSRLKAKHIQVQRMIAEPITLNLLLIDIDYFKKVNDTYGHLNGDAVLKQLAQVLKKQLRGTDSVYRYGGEEFAIVMPDTDIQEAENAAERIREAVEKTAFAIQSKKKKALKATVSIGLAHIEGAHLVNTKITDMIIPKLIARADKALYKAKEYGRNQVVVWNK